MVDRIITQLAEEVYFQTEDALIHDIYPGFKEDYLVTHSLLRRHNPNSILEIGTNIGSGVNVMAKACPRAVIYSLDLDYETMRLDSKQYPISPSGKDLVGSVVKVPYKQLRGDSLFYPYYNIPYMEAWYIDGEHDYLHVVTESMYAICLEAKLIIWHDADFPPVWKGLVSVSNLSNRYAFFRVTDTRIAYAVKI